MNNRHLARLVDSAKYDLERAIDGLITEIEQLKG